MYALPPKFEHFTAEWCGYLELCLPIYLSWYFAVILVGVYDILLFLTPLKIYSSQPHKTWEELLHLESSPIHRLNTQHQEAVCNLVKAPITVGNVLHLCNWPMLLCHCYFEESQTWLKYHEVFHYCGICSHSVQQFCLNVCHRLCSSWVPFPKLYCISSLCLAGLNFLIASHRFFSNVYYTRHYQGRCVEEGLGQ